MLFWSGVTPLRLVPFLDDAALRLGFLQKVGGGYMFVHRTLLEYFVAIASEDLPNEGPATTDMRE